MVDQPLRLFQFLRELRAFARASLEGVGERFAKQELGQH
jgi:hypothetical protein